MKKRVPYSRVQHEKRATRKNSNMKIAKHEKSATRKNAISKECNMKKEQYEKSEI